MLERGKGWKGEEGVGEDILGNEFHNNECGTDFGWAVVFELCENHGCERKE